jgi:hypothetical protein
VRNSSKDENIRKRIGRSIFSTVTLLSLLLCVTACVLWAGGIRYPRIGNGWLVFGSRYTLSLLPDRMAILGPSPSDPAASKRIRELAEAMRATGGVLRYHGTTGGMGFGDFDYSGKPPMAGVFPQAGEIPSPPPIFRDLGDAPIRMLMAALEDERMFLMAHALLARTHRGEKASDDPRGGLKLWLEETSRHSGHWTGPYDGIHLDLIEDTPRGNQGSWGQEIWARVTTPQITPAERARICRLWHERLDVTLWTARYSHLAPAMFALPAISLATSAARRLRRRNRRTAGRCLECNYDLRATPDRCPECGALTER